MTTGYKPDRFARAVQLVLSGRVERLGGSQYRVAGNVEPTYDVDLTGDPMCYCRDMENRGVAIKYQCKHVLSARLAGLDPSLVQVLADRIEREQQEADAARPKRKKPTEQAA